MSDNYQAVYDAVRSKFSYFDASHLMESVTGQFDISHAVYLVQASFQESAYEMQRPCVLFKPTVCREGNQWCAFYGEFATGIAGFGDSVAEAMLDFDKEWNTPLATKKESDSE